jgi:DNA-binding GntR family transcriptional regulator
VLLFCDSNRAVLYLDQGSIHKTLAEHGRVVDALAAGDSAAAEAAMRTQIRRVRADIESLRDEDGESGAE